MPSAPAKAPTPPRYSVRLGGWVPILIAAWIVFPLLLVFGSTAQGVQTRQQCNQCCEKQYEGDQFYIDQCKLKCHRNHDHCILEKSSKPQIQKKKPAKKKKRRAKRRKRKKTKTITLKWPDPLQVVPNQEVLAAARILEVNGIGLQHPKFFQALQEVTAVLIQFRITHPQGGDLPTEPLKDVLLRYL